MGRAEKTDVAGEKLGNTCSLHVLDASTHSHSAAIAALASRPSAPSLREHHTLRAMLLRNTATSQQRPASAHQ